MSTLTRWLEASLASGGDASALLDGESTLSYAELEALSRACVGAFVARGIAPGDRVLVRGDRTARTVAALLGLLRLGAPYAVLDPRLPAPRADRLRALFAPKLEVVPEELDVAVPAPASTGAGPSAEAAAYFFFTSGSTGEPKGVEISQAAALAFARWAAGGVGLRAGDVVAATNALSFDLSVFDLWSALGGGASVALAPAAARALPGELARFLAEREVTVWYTVPSSVRLLAGRKLPALRALVCAGDAFPAAAAERVRADSGCRLYNFYGPTETNVCLAHEVGSPATEPVPIGLPVAGDEAWILRDDGGVAADGAGELLIGGPTVMSGYLGDPAATDGAFVAYGGRRLYRTGDLVARAPGGPFFFRGRRDGLVKVWGYRVHPLEAEAALAGLPGVRDAAVVAVPDARAGHVLRAFACGAGLVAAELRAGLASALPPALVPGEVRVVEHLPLTPNGKIDREALRR